MTSLVPLRPFEMTLRTSEVAVCRSNVSLSSRVSRATSALLPVDDELERGSAFGTLQRFGFGAL
jgi:hypothetical protein